MSFDPSICPVCGKEFYPSSDHALTDTHGSFVCSCHCSTAAYEKRYGGKPNKVDRMIERQLERERDIYERKKAEGENFERKPRFKKPVLVVRKKDGEVMSRHPSVREAAKATGFTAPMVSMVCRGSTETRGEYTFVFEKEEQRPKDGVAEYSRTPALKPVLQFDLKGNYIARYDSQVDAVKATGIAQANISACCCHKQYQTKGFVFMFESEFNEFEKGNNNNENYS